MWSNKLGQCRLDMLVWKFSNDATSSLTWDLSMFSACNRIPPKFNLLPTLPHEKYREKAKSNKSDSLKVDSNPTDLNQIHDIVLAKTKAVRRVNDLKDNANMIAHKHTATSSNFADGNNRGDC
eukprot:m.110500 g.110500  ORF g.110500 m.110500 type:complete len:123 (+) comp15272_c0_seq3:4166-4534(+)